MEDGQIVELYWQRSDRAIEETQRKYGAYCRAVANGILRNEADAEECVNDVLAGAWNAMPPHRPENLAAFLGKIARRLALKRFRDGAAVKRGGGETALALEELEEIVPEGGGPEEQVAERELARAINGFLAGLSADQRRIFLCRYWYFDSVGEIARRFGCSESKVKMTCKRVRDRLSQYLKKEGYIL
jgi:RNA polymerase sigma-70 factor (ECF subfamily)